jgi:hypothetical protein
MNILITFLLSFIIGGVAIYFILKPRLKEVQELDEKT